MRRTSRTWRTWMFAWLGMALLALANGTLRALVVQPRAGEEAARQVATALLLLLLTAYAWWLQGRHPIPEARTAWGVGFAWVGLTLAFEFGFGLWVEGLAWSTMLADYDLTEGRLWALVPLWTAMLPALTRRLRLRSQHGRLQRAGGPHARAGRRGRRTFGPGVRA